MAESIILPNNGRTRQLFDIESTARGKAVKDIVVENDAISLSCYTADIDVNSAIITITIEQIGNNENNRQVIRRIGPITKISEFPVNEIITVNGILRITVEYTGSITFDMHGRAVGAAAAIQESVQDVEVVLSADDKAYRAEHLSLLHTIQDSLERIVNHSRIITSVEQDKGEKF